MRLPLRPFFLPDIEVDQERFLARQVADEIADRGVRLLRIKFMAKTFV